MASLSPRRVSNTQQRFSNRLLALLAALVLASTTATASEGEGDYAELSTYSAKYRLSKHGLKVDVTRTLKEGADGSFTLAQNGKNMVASIHDMSVFRVEGKQIIPKSYVYQLRAPLVKRRREVHFTPGADTIRSLYKDSWYDLPYTEGTLDRMSQQEQLRLFLLNDPTPKEDLSFRVADGKRVKQYDFTFVAEETLQTALGPLRTLHFRREHDDPDRKSDTWIAPDLDYLMVKTTHTEEGTPMEMVITSAQVEGVESAK